jgi:hypothetical protein
MYNKRTFIFAAVVLVALHLFPKWMQQIKYWTNWPAVQTQRGINLAIHINAYQERFHAYPAKMDDLIEKKVLTAEELRKLSFQQSPFAKFQSWTYTIPRSSRDIIIASPLPVSSSQSYILVLADNSAQLLTETKMQLFRKILERQIQQVK